MSDATRWVLDTQRLADSVDAVRFHRGISCAEVARELGVSPSTVTRIAQGKPPDADALVSLLMWLRVDVATFARERSEAT